MGWYSNKWAKQFSETKLICPVLMIWRQKDKCKHIIYHLFTTLITFLIPVPIKEKLILFFHLKNHKNLAKKGVGKKKIYSRQKFDRSNEFFQYFQFPLQYSFKKSLKLRINIKIKIYFFSTTILAVTKIRWTRIWSISSGRRLELSHL